MMKGGNITSINNSHSSGGEYVSELQAPDVLVGRSSGPTDHTVVFIIKGPPVAVFLRTPRGASKIITEK
jgi:hypothetical protein